MLGGDLTFTSFTQKYKKIEDLSGLSDLNLTPNEGFELSQLYDLNELSDHLKYLVQNRFKYCDSKWNTGDYPQNYISMRVNTPSFDQSKYDEASDEDKLKMLALKKSIEVVPPSPVSNIAISQLFFAKYIKLSDVIASNHFTGTLCVLL